MRKTNPLFTPAERRVAWLALLSAAVLTLTLMVAERAWTPPLGIYGSNAATLQMPNVIDATPLSRSATL